MLLSSAIHTCKFVFVDNFSTKLIRSAEGAPRATNAATAGGVRAHMRAHDCSSLSCKGMSSNASSNGRNVVTAARQICIRTVVLIEFASKFVAPQTVRKGKTWMISWVLFCMTTNVREAGEFLCTLIFHGDDRRWGRAAGLGATRGPGRYR